MAAAALAPASVAAQGRPPLSRIAFGSCADQAKPQPIWDAILAYRPELFIFAGDNVYGDFSSEDAANLKRAYETAEGIAGYNRLRETVAHLAVWDDHDYGINDGGGDFPHKAVSKELFLKFWKVPATDIRPTRDGIYDSKHHRSTGHAGADHPARPALVPFATESHRPARRGGQGTLCPRPDPAKTMLVPLQWAWLAGELRKPAEIRLIVSSTQVLAEGHGWERWGNMPLERQKFLDTIRDSGAKGVVLLSGDAYRRALSRDPILAFIRCMS